LIVLLSSNMESLFNDFELRNLYLILEKKRCRLEKPNQSIIIWGLFSTKSWVIPLMRLPDADERGACPEGASVVLGQP
ncbi:MAG: hypothetical protein NWF14_08295, partial [Candidatus Bathyarchaeota archaeon]|nr:hypothetical protein [Candidatus Bathyarchaeota archaeon]